MASLTANGITIEYETFGDSSRPAVLLIVGLGLQMIAWEETFCRRIAAAGFHVIRFDNRDCGLSTAFDEAGVPNVALLYLKYLMHWPLRPAYSLDDMALDACGVLDALGIRQAHVVGASMGGMIAQNLAARHPDRVLSLTSIMSTTGSRQLPRPLPRALRELLAQPARHGDVEGAVNRLQRLLRAIGSLSHPEAADVLRERCERHVRRAYRPEGMARQLAAIGAAGDRSALIRTISRPVLVIHGDEDPLLQPACGEATARLIPGAELMIVRGMGHDLPEPLLPSIIARMTAHFRAVG